MGNSEERKRRRRERLLLEAENARIRARYQPTSELQRRELDAAEKLEQNAEASTYFANL